MFGGARSVLTLFGFDIRIDPSWLLIAALVTWSLAEHVFPNALPQADRATHLIMSVVAMLALFASLIAHELSHATVARHFGVRTKSITLFLFGGVAEFREEPKAPAHEFWIALAGPAMSFALALLFWLAAGSAVALSQSPAMVEVLAYLALINLVLAVFNLLPAFPLDGGRVLRAWLWHRSGDVLRATETAANAGSFLAFALIFLGMLALFQGGLMGGLWQILIGLFLLGAARASIANQQAQSHLKGRHVRDLMSAPPITVEPQTTLATLVNRIMLHHRVSFVPVVEEGVLLGHITTRLLSRIDRENWASTQVGDVFAPLDPALCVAPDMPAQDLLKQMSDTGERKFMVVEDRHLVGVVSLSDTLRLLGLLTSLRTAANGGQRAA